MEYKDLIKTAYCCDIKACDDCPSKGRTCCRERAMQELSHALDKEAARAESAESAQETLQRAVAEYKARAEKAEERARKAEEEINKNSACWMCVKNEDCHKGWAVKEPDCKCGSFVWRGQKEE